MCWYMMAVIPVFSSTEAKLRLLVSSESDSWGAIWGEEEGQEKDEFPLLCPLLAFCNTLSHIPAQHLNGMALKSGEITFLSHSSKHLQGFFSDDFVCVISNCHCSFPGF